MMNHSIKKIRASKVLQTKIFYILPLKIQHQLAVDSSFDYDNWDDPNDLVDHLRILVTKRNAGFIGYENEIQFIFEELREAEIIY